MGIPLEKIKRNNSNIYAYDFELFKELRKERFREPKLEKYVQHQLATERWINDPYDSIDARLDIEKFMEKLSERDSEIFELYFVFGMNQEDIESYTGISQGMISRILFGNEKKKEVGLVTLFKEFYCNE